MQTQHVYFIKKVGLRLCLTQPTYTIQNLIEQAKEVIQPGTAAKIVMECAIPMSKVILNFKQEQ